MTAWILWYLQWGFVSLIVIGVLDSLRYVLDPDHLDEPRFIGWLMLALLWPVFLPLAVVLHTPRVLLFLFVRLFDAIGRLVGRLLPDGADKTPHWADKEDPWGVKRPNPSPWWFVLPPILIAGAGIAWVDWNPVAEHARSAQTSEGALRDPAGSTSEAGYPSRTGESIPRSVDETGSRKATRCSDEDLRDLAHVRPELLPSEVYGFGLRVQEAIRDKDMLALYALAKGPLSNGPRRSVVSTLSFDQVFPMDWRKRALEEEPRCAPVGWRGFAIGYGAIWYDKQSGGEWSIVSINGANRVDVPEGGRWIANGDGIEPACFAYEWYSSNNYQELHDQFASDVPYSRFTTHIGQYLGSTIPLQPISASRDDTYKVAIARRLPHCHGGERDDITYETLRVLKRSSCQSLAPALSDACQEVRLIEQEVRLIEVVGPCGGSLGCRSNVSIYGLVREPAEQGKYVVPLLNFQTENEALDYVESRGFLAKSPADGRLSAPERR